MVSIGVQGGVYRQAACLQCPARPRMLCAGMTNELLPALGSIATDVRLDKGETLFYEGDDAKYVYNVKKAMSASAGWVWTDAVRLWAF